MDTESAKANHLFTSSSLTCYIILSGLSNIYPNHLTKIDLHPCPSESAFSCYALRIPFSDSNGNDLFHEIFKKKVKLSSVTPFLHFYFYTIPTTHTIYFIIFPATLISLKHACFLDFCNNRYRIIHIYQSLYFKLFSNTNIDFLILEPNSKIFIPTRADKLPKSRKPSPRAGFSDNLIYFLNISKI